MENSSMDNLGPAVLSIAWVFAGLSIAIVIARFYVRLRIVKRIGLDDCIILITLLLGLGNSIFLTISCSWGLGRHVQALISEPERVLYTVKWVYLCELFAIMSAGFGRISFAFLLLGLSPFSKPRRIFLWSIIFIQFVIDVGTVIVSFSQCRPIEGFWDKSVEAECWPPYVQQYTGFLQGSVCSMVDLMLALFPASLFWNLNMEWKQKAFLIGIMGLGVFAMIASIVKTIQLQALTQTDDLTYAMAKLAIWWTLEAYIVLVAVSIPTIRPILKTPTAFLRSKLRHVNNAKVLFSFERGPGYNATENNGSFEPLQDPTLTNEARNYEYAQAGSATSSYALQNLERNEVSRPDIGSIRRDITVSVIFDKPRAGVQS
ncbi:hypothetical protein F4809DRAFT_634625 [Biscogniauxia mediterranea]|nr:hypothetical protein F4809DRAFT_634625 [Biscogniauxia mediterranea]